MVEGMVGGVGVRPEVSNGERGEMVGSVGGVLLLLFWVMAERTCLVVC